MQQGDILKETQKFTDLQQELQSERSRIVDILVTDPGRAKPDPGVLAAADKLVVKLDEFGIKPASELSNRLVAAFVSFSAIRAVAAQPFSLCDFFPFSVLC
jgi:hypothetical protein